MSQLGLFSVRVDERTLSDVERALLEAIDRAGSITLRDAGRIVYRLRGWTLLVATPRAWLHDAGRRPLERLRSLGLVRRAKRGAWVRSDLIGPGRSPGPHVARSGHGLNEPAGMASANTPCKSPLFASASADLEHVSGGTRAQDREEYERRRTASAVAGGEPARLRDSVQGDDGRVDA